MKQVGEISLRYRGTKYGHGVIYINMYKYAWLSPVSNLISDMGDLTLYHDKLNFAN